MSGNFPESDWRAFRKLREVALERFSERILGEISRVTSDGRSSPHDRYLQIYKLIMKRDRQIARAFNDPRRSNFFMQLTAIYALDLVKDDELLAFTPATQGIVQSLGKPDKPAR